MQSEFDDIFHLCAMAAYAVAQAEGLNADVDYVKGLAYELYERERHAG